MFSFFNNKKAPFSIATDIHAHLLPGIDDGAETMGMTIEMIEKFIAMGYKKLVATPHVYGEYYPNTKEKIIDRFLEVKKELSNRAIAIQLSVAAEYYLDDYFDVLLEKEELLTIDERYVLIEWSMLSPNLKLSEQLFKLQLKGYKPIIAHPERYLYLKEEDYAQLLEQGGQFQINILSLLGHYGLAVQKRAQFLLKKYPAVYLGTDAHHPKHLQLVDQFFKSSKSHKLFRNKTFLNNQIFQNKRNRMNTTL